MKVYFNDLVRLRSSSGISVYANQMGTALSDLLGRAFVPISKTLFATPLQPFFRSWIHSSSTHRTTAWKTIAEKFGFELLDLYLSASSRFFFKGLYHEPDAIPLRMGLPTIVTVHDLTVLLFPHWHPVYRVRKYEKCINRAIQRTHHFIAVSERTKEDLIRLLHVPPTRISVIAEAPRLGLCRMAETDQKAVRERFRLPSRFFIHVGTLEPRKNIEGLIDAFERIPSNLQSECPLVLVGSYGWKSESISHRISKSPHVIHLSGQSDPVVMSLISSAVALVYPSFYEGFGLPPLEAMAVGTPVISSSAGALSETVKDAALRVEPHDLEEMTSAMMNLLKNRELREIYQKRGDEHVKQFSWKRAAQATLGVYARVAENAYGQIAATPFYNLANALTSVS